MDTKSLALAALTILVLIGGYQLYHNQVMGSQYSPVAASGSSSVPSTSSSGGDVKYIPPNPSVVAILATSPSCLYCNIIESQLKNAAILKVYNVERKIEYDQLISELSRRNLNYIGVPTVLIGSFAFYSYQDTDTCPYFNGKQSQPVVVKIGKESVELCRIPDYPNYYIYMPERVARLIHLCNKYKDPACFA